MTAAGLSKSRARPKVTPFRRAEFDAMLDLAAQGIDELIKAQETALNAT